MKSKFEQKIIELFASDAENVTFTENLEIVELSFTCQNLSLIESSIDSIRNLLEIVNQRDYYEITVKIDSNDPLMFRANDDYLSFYKDCDSQYQLKDDIIRITISIYKKIQDNTISLYFTNQFSKYTSNQIFSSFLYSINKYFSQNKCLIIESQIEEINIQTRTIIITNNKINEIELIKHRSERIEKTQNISSCELMSEYNFIPDDFCLIVEDARYPKLNDLFNRMKQLYSIIFLFDFIKINTNFQYKLNGYKTINKSINVSDIDFKTNNIYYQIYEWSYNDGNIFDKIGLARNIISLNLNPENLKLTETTFDSIKSSFKIYQKENIKQYIEIRNKISDQLITLQNNADKIVDNYINDYKKSLLTIVSFFISVIVIRVVSKGDFTGGFTFEVTMLSLGFLTIFLLLMIYSRWEIKKQVERYKEFYENLKIRHGDLLHESDIKRILNNDTDFNKNISFIKKRETFYTILWILSFALLLFIVLLLFSINNSCSFCCLIKTIFIKIISCFSRNI